MLLIDVKTTNTNKYNFACLSAPILVKATSESVLTSSQDTEPNMYLTFSGNFSSQSEDNLKKFATMIYNCLLIDFGLLAQTTMQLYAGSIKAVVDSSGSAASYANLVNSLSDNSTNFTLASGVTLQAATINGISIVKSTQSNTNQDPSSAQTTNDENNAVNKA